MSNWYLVKGPKDLEISIDKKFVDVLFDNDPNGNNYVSIPIEFLEALLRANPLDAQVSFAEPNQQLFTVEEVMSFLEAQKKDCVEAYRENTEDYQIYDDTICAIENAPPPTEFIKKIKVKS